MLNSKRNTYVLPQTDPSYRMLETLCLTFELGDWRPDCQKRILFWSKTSKCRACSGVKLQKFGACSGFLEVKNQPWSVAHTRILDIRKSPPGYPAPELSSKQYTQENGTSPDNPTKQVPPPRALKATEQRITLNRINLYSRIHLGSSKPHMTYISAEL